MDVVCMGDSLTYGYGIDRKKVWVAILSQTFPKVRFWNRGVCGDTTEDMLIRFNRDVISHEPGCVILMGGSNDIFFERDAEKAKRNLVQMMKVCKAHKSAVLLGTPLPVEACSLSEEWKPEAEGNQVQALLKELHDWILEFGATHKIPVLDFWACIPGEEEEKQEFYLDGIHPTEYGHKIIADFIIADNSLSSFIS